MPTLRRYQNTALPSCCYPFIFETEAIYQSAVCNMTFFTMRRTNSRRSKKRWRLYATLSSARCTRLVVVLVCALSRFSILFNCCASRITHLKFTCNTRILIHVGAGPDADIGGSSTGASGGAAGGPKIEELD